MFTSIFSILLKEQLDWGGAEENEGHVGKMTNTSFLGGKNATWVLYDILSKDSNWINGKIFPLEENRILGIIPDSEAICQTE